MNRAEFLKTSATSLALLAVLPYVALAKSKPSKYQLVGTAFAEGRAEAWSKVKAHTLLQHKISMEKTFIYGGIYEKRGTQKIFRYEGKSKLRNMITGEVTKV